MDDETTEPETPAVEPEKVAEHPEHTAEHVEPHGDLRDVVAGLTEKVAHLEGVVTGLLPENREKDEKPVRRPWTHRKFG